MTYKFPESDIEHSQMVFTKRNEHERVEQVEPDIESPLNMETLVKYFLPTLISYH